MATDIKNLHAYLVTHRSRSGHVERWHWQLDTVHGFCYRGDNEDLMGWSAQVSALRAGRKAMRAYFARSATGDGNG
jgi:hypothetical protein